MDAYEAELRHALTGAEVEHAKSELHQTFRDAAQELTREREGRSYVLGEVEGLRAELEQFRAQIGSEIGVTLERP
jgi:hypothetical protein